MGVAGHPTSHPCGRSKLADAARPRLSADRPSLHRSRYRLDRPHADSDCTGMPVGPAATAQQGSAESREIDALCSRVPRPPTPTPCGARAGGEAGYTCRPPLCPRLHRWGWSPGCGLQSLGDICKKRVCKLVDFLKSLIRRSSLYVHSTSGIKDSSLLRTSANAVRMSPSSTEREAMCDRNASAIFCPPARSIRKLEVVFSVCKVSTSA